MKPNGEVKNVSQNIKLIFFSLFSELLWPCRCKDGDDSVLLIAGTKEFGLLGSRCRS